jgi:hypothetical protein
VPSFDSLALALLVEELDELVDPRLAELLVVAVKRGSNAGVQVRPEYDRADLAEGRADGGDLMENVHAVAIVLDHPLHPRDLASNPAETTFNGPLLVFTQHPQLLLPDTYTGYRYLMDRGSDAVKRPTSFAFFNEANMSN